MKIAILTLPLHNNYGGILQAYALLTTLRNRGHEVWLIDYRPGGSSPPWKIPFALIKRFFMKYVVGKDIDLFFEANQRRYNKNLQSFLDQHITPKTAPIFYSDQFRKLDGYGFTHYIVGSDQVWREKYNRNYSRDFFLDFVSGSQARRIAYAASFGNDFWEYDPVLTEHLSDLAQKFHALSVREDSGVGLCKKYLKVDVACCLDPTMLLEISDYQNLVAEEPIENTGSGLLTYILDSNGDKKSISREVEQALNLRSFSIGHQERSEVKRSREYAHPSISHWLYGFHRARFILTDSFHGCVFSILYNKPFLVIGNRERGISRFTSLLKMFDLEERIVTPESDIKSKIALPEINWNKINTILQDKREKSFVFLDNSLN